MVMTEEEILQGFAETLEEFAGVAADMVTPEAELAEDLDIDSLSMVEVVVAVQDKFGIIIPDEDLTDIKTVQDVVSYVQRAQHPAVSA